MLSLYAARRRDPLLAALRTCTGPMEGTHPVRPRHGQGTPDVHNWARDREL
jgi:hypothetical protein